jgi:hypothetical protein
MLLRPRLPAAADRWRPDGRSKAFERLLDVLTDGGRSVEGRETFAARVVVRGCAVRLGPIPSERGAAA